MPLKTVVKVGNISNLSDARYCAGMGVDMLGFRVIEGQPDYISPKLYQEIRGWVSGPKVVAEIYGITSADQLKGIIESYAPDYFELSEDEFQQFKSSLTLPCIVASSFKPDHTSVAYQLIDEDQLGSVQNSSDVLVQVRSVTNLKNILSNFPNIGVALSGSQEVRPGFKDYSDLAEILEQLDEE